MTRVRCQFWKLKGVALVLLVSVPLARAQESGSISEKALTGKSGPLGATLFRIMPPEETGVKTENKYDDPQMWGDRYQEFLFGGIGTGVAIGDYDGDGRPDLFVVSKTESCRLFRNLGNWKFEDVTEKAGVGDKGDAAKVWKQGATFVDINNDGLLDIYVCRFGAPNLLYINQGDGTFKEMAHAYGLDVVDACGMAAFCDYDRDGHLDVYIQTNLYDAKSHPNGQRGYLFHNNGDNTFTNVTEKGGIEGESESHSATWWDYDDDGWPDLYVANDFGKPDKLYHNNRDGTFTDVIAQVVPHTSFSSMGADIGDVNNDGREDLLVGDMAATTHELDQRGQAEERAKARDVRPDATGTQKYHRNALLLNTGTPRVLEAAYLAGIAATDWTWAVRFEDLDNDGKLDLFVANGMNKEENIDLIARQMRAETATERIRIMRESPLLEQNHFGFRNLGHLEFEDVSAAWGLNQKGISFGAAFGDLDGDGDLDLVYSNFGAGITVLRNDAQEGHRVLIDLRGVESNRFGVGAKVKIETNAGVQVRTLTLARGYMSSSEPVIHFGLGDDKTIAKLTIYWPSGIEQVFHNLEVDRRYLITEPREKPAAHVAEKSAAQFKEVSNELGLAIRSRENFVDEVSTQMLLPAALNRQGPALAVGDLAGTGGNDLVIGGTPLDPTRVVHLGRMGASTPLEIETLPVKEESRIVDDGPVLVFDARGTGASDLLVTHGGNSLPDGSPEYQPRLFFNDGHGRFQLAPDGALPSLPISAGAVAAADFARTGSLGLFIGGRLRPGDYPAPAQSALLINRGGKFEDVTATYAPQLSELGLVTSALWTDVDGDGWIDLLISLEWGGVKYFHNDHGQKFEDWSERAGFAQAGNGWWTSLAAADFNGDGRMDYVVGNVGLNTPYRASVESPALLFAGNFKSEDSTQLVEAYAEAGKLYPWRSRRDLGMAIPSILRRFPLTDAYAKATLPEIVGREKLAAAEKYSATEFRSGVFMSQPDGTYQFELLPRIAQIAPLQGIVAGDFDGDGLADIYTVQNSYAPIPAVGRFDGGLSQLLKGDGHGHFTAISVAESGLMVPGDAKALVVTDVNGDHWPDFVVSRNNDALLSFINRPRNGGDYLEVKLEGSAGNRRAIGACVTLIYADGSKQCLEVSAGGGHYSQSSASCFFGYGGQRRPSKISVRWPDGGTTEKSLTLPLTSPLILKSGQ